MTSGKGQFSPIEIEHNILPPMRKVGNNPGRFCDIAEIDRYVKLRRPFWVVKPGWSREGRKDRWERKQNGREPRMSSKSREEEE